MFCRFCGKEIDDDSVFCKECGKQLNEVSSNSSIHTLSAEEYAAREERYKNFRGARAVSGVGFPEAIKRFYINTFDFKGRASASEFWWIFLYSIIADIPLSSLAESETTALSVLGIVLSCLWVAFHFIPSLSLVVRRLHDVGKSGFWCLFGFVPVVGNIALLIWMASGSKADNDWGPKADEATDDD